MRSAACFGRNCSALRNLKRNASSFTNVVDPSSVAILWASSYATLSFIYDNPSNVHEAIYSERTGDYLDELDQLIQDYNNNLNLLEVH